MVTHHRCASLASTAIANRLRPSGDGSPGHQVGPPAAGGAGPFSILHRL